MELGPDYRRLWAAGAVSNLGDGAYLGALPLLAAAVSRDPVDISLVAAAGWLPWLLVGLLSGAVADRGDRLRIMVVADLVRFAVLGVLAAVVLLGTPTTAVLIGSALALGTAQTLFDSAGQALVPLVVGRDRGRLSRANGQFAASQTIGRELAGPPVGSGLFAVLPALPLLLDAVSFVLSAGMLRTVHRAPHPPPAAGRPSIRSDVADGLRWLAAHRVVLVMAVVVGLSNVAWVGAESVLVLLARDRLGIDARWFGALLAAPAVGAVPGTLLAGTVRRHVPAGVVFLGGLVLQSVVLLGIGLTTDPYVCAALLAAGGLLITVWNITQAVHRQLLVPDRVTGRVVASMRMIAYGSAPVGAVLGGVCAGALGLSAPFVLAAGVMLLATALAAPYLNGRSLAAAQSAVAD